MVQSIVFVHGTGVRGWSYKVSADKVARALRSRGYEGHFEPCLWGDKHGAKLARDGRSIPDFAGVEAAEPDGEAYRALWSLLAHDPYYELREVTGDSKPGGRVAPAAKQELDDFPSTLRSVAGYPAVLECSRILVADAGLLSAVQTVAGSQALKQALQSASSVDTALRQAAARAVVALVQTQRSDEERLEAGEAGDPAPLPTPQRDALVTAIVDQLGGIEMGGVSDWIKKRLVGLGARWATGMVQRKRDVVYNAAYPAAGDILLYQKDGAAIRDEIEAHISACNGDVAVIAHSLGGIASVDLLVERELPKVKLLVTVGSQAPLLYELGALRSLAALERLPRYFPPKWINFYDLNDLLSYRAATVFDPPSKDMVLRDIQVASNQPFPMSHSAYWESTTLWDELQKHL
jgi:hypothetical protein